MMFTHLLILVYVFIFVISTPEWISVAGNRSYVWGIGWDWRWLGSTFLHTSFSHLWLNLLALVVHGTIAEKRFGSRFVAMTYALSALSSSITSSVFLPLHQVSVGASGAIYGLASLSFLSSQGVAEYTILMLSELLQLQHVLWIAPVLCVVPFVLRFESWSAHTLLLFVLALSNLNLYGETAVIDHGAHVGGLAIGGMAFWVQKKCK